eukprot:2019545-Pleurochrysis_carterae.AAC.2
MHGRFFNGRTCAPHENPGIRTALQALLGIEKEQPEYCASDPLSTKPTASLCRCSTSPPPWAGSALCSFASASATG